MSQVPSVGVVFLEDLVSFAPWMSHRAPEWTKSRGFKGNLLPPTTYPPPGLVVICKSHVSDVIMHCAAWLRLTQRVALVVTTDPPDEEDADPDVEDLIREEWAGVGSALGAVAVLFTETYNLNEIIDAALKRVEVTAPWEPWAPHTPSKPVKGGGWVLMEPPFWGKGTMPDGEECLRHLASQACVLHGVPTLFDSVTGVRWDLTTGKKTQVPALAERATYYNPVAMAPNGLRWLARDIHPLGERRSEFTWHLEAETGAKSHHTVPDHRWGRPIGIDPSNRVAWSGGRCWFDWRVMTPEGPAFWTPSNHHWPCGHGKKLYGYENNEPLWVHLSPDASTCLSVYAHDALITPGMPLRWRDVGALAVGERMGGEPRAVFFERTESEDAYPADPSEGDEDARDCFATVTLGPSDKARYVVGFGAPVWRVRGDKGELLDPKGAGWVVYNSTHKPVRSGTGHLLAGWHQWIVVEEDGRLRREDLLTGRTEDLGETGADIRLAVALPGTPNVVLLTVQPGEEEGEEDAYLRVV